MNKPRRIRSNDDLPPTGEWVLAMGRGPEEVAVAEVFSIYENGYALWQLRYSGSYAGDGDMEFEPSQWLPLNDAWELLCSHDNDEMRDR